MNKSKAPLVMLEQMVMLLVFALAAALCLQAFVKSDAASRTIEARDRAANLCQSVAETLRSNGGDEDGAVSLVLGAYRLEDRESFRVPLAEDMTPAAPDGDAVYWLALYAASCQAPGLDGRTVAVTDESGEELFSLEIMWQVEVTE